MKFEKINEDFTTKYELAKHYAYHVKLKDKERQDSERDKFDPISAQHYEDMANKLAKARAGKAHSDNDIVGYINRRDVACKYWKSAKQFVVYVPDTTDIITFYKLEPKKYLDRLKNEFKEELPENMLREDLNIKKDNLYKLLDELKLNTYSGTFGRDGSYIIDLESDAIFGKVYTLLDNKENVYQREENSLLTTHSGSLLYDVDVDGVDYILNLKADFDSNQYSLVISEQ